MAAACVVVGQSVADIGGKANVELWSRIGSPQNVDESFVFRHARRRATPMPNGTANNRPNVRDGRRRIGVSATGAGRRAVNRVARRAEAHASPLARVSEGWWT